MSTHTHPIESEKKNILTLPVAIMFGSLLIACAILLTHGGTTQAPTQQAADAAAGGASLSGVRAPDAQDHIVGSLDAKVTIIEYSDFECPYCSLVYPTLKQAVADMQGQVAWVYREFPLDSIHPEARPAAEAAECLASELGNDAFWKFADAIFGDQKDMNAQLYTTIAAQLGADPKAFADCTSSKKFDSHISSDEAEGVSAGGNGTPFIVVVGKDGTRTSFSGALPLAQVESIIKSVLAKQK